MFKALLWNFQDDRTCWMEAIKPGSCQEDLVVSGDSEDKDEDPYDSVDAQTDRLL